MSKHVMVEAIDALRAVRDEGASTQRTLRQCEMAIESLVVAIKRLEDEDEAAAQRARDKCIGAYGYDISRLGPHRY